MLGIMATRRTPTEIAEGMDGNEKSEWILTASIDELRDFLRIIPPQGAWAARARDMLGLRLAEVARRPHWTIIPAFIVGFLALIFAAIAALPVIQSWFQE